MTLLSSSESTHTSLPLVSRIASLFVFCSSYPRRYRLRHELCRRPDLCHGRRRSLRSPPPTRSPASQREAQGQEGRERDEGPDSQVTEDGGDRLAEEKTEGSHEGSPGNGSGDVR